MDLLNENKDDGACASGAEVLLTATELFEILVLKLQAFVKAFLGLCR